MSSGGFLRCLRSRAHCSATFLIFRWNRRGDTCFSWPSRRVSRLSAQNASSGYEVGLQPHPPASATQNRLADANRTALESNSRSSMSCDIHSWGVVSFTLGSSFFQAGVNLIATSFHRQERAPQLFPIIPSIPQPARSRDFCARHPHGSLPTQTRAV